MNIIKTNYDEFYNELKSKLTNKSIIPIIGSGFSRRCRARNGKVPSGNDMKLFMINEIKKIDLKSDLENKNFSEISSYYEKKVSESIRDTYLKNNFTNVMLERYKREFLEAWDMIYTLNIDDGIENAIDCEVIHPNQGRYKISNLKSKQVVVKLHGDAKNVLKYSDDKKIFTKRQYFKSLNSNSELLSIFREDYYNNNIIYIGCSLEDEADLYSVTGDIKNLDVLTKKYFISNNEIDDFDISTLEEYGITDVIIINEIEDFYIKIVDLFNNEIQIENEKLNYFSNPEICSLPIGYKKNYDYLCYSNLDSFKENKLVFPNFFIERECIKKNFDKIVSEPITFFEGNRISGKTYILLNIIKRIRDRKIYFFPSTTMVSFDLISELLMKSNCVFVFDSNSLEVRQINYFANRVKTIRDKNNNVIIAINTSDKDILTMFDYRNLKIQHFRIDNKFTTSEIEDINKKLSLSDLLIFDSEKTMFDNLISATEEKSSYLLSIDNERKYSVAEIVIFIIIATKEKIYDSELLKFGLTDSIGVLHDKVQPVIQYDYSEWFQSNYRSQHKVIQNAKIWILKLLGSHSKTQQDKNKIANAYEYIAKRIKQNSDSTVSYFKEMSGYINFDVINEIFPSSDKGVIDLITKIYDTVHDYLADDPQYFHQRSKAYLWLYQNDLEKLFESLKFARKAAHDLNIKRNIKEEKTYTSYCHIEFSIATIIGRIVKVQNYGNKEMIIDAIEMYSKAMNEPINKSYTKKLLKKTKNVDLERRDFRDLVRYLQINSNKYLDYKSQIEELANLIYRN